MDGKVREVIYFSRGFFGYGEMGNFRQWSLAHFLPVILAIAAIILICSILPCLSRGNIPRMTASAL